MNDWDGPSHAVTVQLTAEQAEYLVGLLTSRKEALNRPETEEVEISNVLVEGENRTPARIAIQRLVNAARRATVDVGNAATLRLTRDQADLLNTDLLTMLPVKTIAFDDAAKTNFSEEEGQDSRDANGGPLAVAELMWRESTPPQLCLPPSELALVDPGDYILQAASLTWRDDARVFEEIRQRAGIRFLAAAAGQGDGLVDLSQPQKLYATKLTSDSDSHSVAEWRTGFPAESTPYVCALTESAEDAIELFARQDTLWLRVQLESLVEGDWVCVGIADEEDPHLVGGDGEVYLFQLDALERPVKRFSPAELTNLGFYLEAWLQCLKLGWNEALLQLQVYFVFADMGTLVSNALKDEALVSTSIETKRRLRSIAGQEISAVLDSLSSRIVPG